MVYSPYPVWGQGQTKTPFARVRLFFGMAQAAQGSEKRFTEHL